MPMVNKPGQMFSIDVDRLVEHTKQTMIKCSPSMREGSIKHDRSHEGKIYKSTSVKNFLGNKYVGYIDESSGREKFMLQKFTVKV